MVLAVLAEAVTAGKRSIGVGSGIAQVVAVLVGIHQVVLVVGNDVDTEVALIVKLQRLVFLTALGRDDDHTVGST